MDEQYYRLKGDRDRGEFSRSDSDRDRYRGNERSWRDDRYESENAGRSQYGGQQSGAASGQRSDWNRDQDWRRNEGATQSEWDRDRSRDFRDRSPGASQFGYTGSSLAAQYGVSGSGLPERRLPKSYQRTDERIREDIYERIVDRAHIDAEDVTVEVTSGKVTLSGEVRDRRAKHEIEDIVDATSGVKDIDNDLRVKRGLLSSIFGGGRDEESESVQSGARSGRQNGNQTWQN